MADVEYRVYLRRNGYGKHLIKKNGSIVYKANDRNDLLINLLVCFQNDFIQTFDDHLILHSALVIRNGIALVLPGPRKSGKSTLVISLLKHGFKYYSDDITAINLKSLRATGFPRAIMIRDNTLSLFPSLKPEITCYGYKLYNGHKSKKIHLGIPSKKVLAPLNKSFPISSIIFPKYSSNGNTFISDIKNSSAVLNLMGCTLNQNRFVDSGFKTAASIVRNIKCYSLQIKDLSKACEIINGLI
ncbi:MAG TPA: hypothetical protein VGA95_13015 [Thermodesulfobacteriota bacterium]